MAYPTSLLSQWRRLGDAGAPAFSAADLVRRLAHARPSTRQRRRDESWGHPEMTLLSALGEEGCPVCRGSAGLDDRYFFWFLHESYAQPEIAEQLAHSLGFCLAHASHLADTEGIGSQIAIVHETLVRHWTGLASTPKGRQSWVNGMAAQTGTLGRCPACRSFDGAVGRSASFLAGMLEDPDVTRRYANPGILCLPHLQRVAPEVGDTSFERLLQLHADTLSSALDAVDGPRREPAGSLDPCIRRLLHLAVGHDPGPGPYRLTAGRQGAAAAIEPAGRGGASIWKLDACPVCIEMRRAWFEWVGWLDTSARAGDGLEDVLPGCADHVWGSVHLGGPALIAATARAAAEAALWQIRPALKQIDAPDPPRRRHSFGWPLVGGRPVHMRVGRARAIFGRPMTCPVCRRLESARDRTLLLLFALLEERPHRTAFETGYGLCLKHCARALGLGPKPAIAECIAAVELAKLSRLEWELTEYLRKRAWSARPEKKDEEQRAPKRALDRCSGFAQPPADSTSMRVDDARSLDSGMAVQAADADQCLNPTGGHVQLCAGSRRLSSERPSGDERGGEHGSQTNLGRLVHRFAEKGR